MESKTWHRQTYLGDGNRVKDVKNRFVVARGEGSGDGMKWEFGISRYRVLHIEWINKKVLLLHLSLITSQILHLQKKRSYSIAQGNSVSCNKP